MKKSCCKRGTRGVSNQLAPPLFVSILLVLTAALLSATALSPQAVTNATRTLNINQSFDFATTNVYNSTSPGWASYLGFVRIGGGDVLGDPTVLTNFSGAYKTIKYVGTDYSLPGCPTYSNVTNANYTIHSRESKQNTTGNGDLSTGDVYCVYTETGSKYAKLRVMSYSSGVNVAFNWTYQSNGSNVFEGGGGPPTTTTTTVPGGGSTTTTTVPGGTTTTLGGTTTSLPGGLDCGALTTPANCSLNSNCEWKNNMCVRRIENPCRNYTTPAQCNNQSQMCFWDNSQWGCMPKSGGEGNTINCSLYSNTSEQQCASYSQCQWNSSSSVCSLSACGANCTACDQGHCPNNPLGCWWDFGMNTCKSAGGEGGGGPWMPTCQNGACDMCLNQSACNTTGKAANALCAWMLDTVTNTNRCLQNTSCAYDCFSCRSPAECSASNNTAFSNTSGANCTWDSSQLRCFPGSMGPGGGGSPCQTNCTICSDKFSCYGSPAQCKWNDSSAIKCTSNPCSSNCSACGTSSDCQYSPMSCVWNPLNSTCAGKTCDSDCTSCPTDTACGTRTPLCAWNNVTGACNYNTSNANATQLACNSNCSLCSSESNCWSSQIGCAWDSGWSQCSKSECNGNCSRCSGAFNCERSRMPGGCHWDAQYGFNTNTGQYFGECVANGYGQSCNDDCFICTSENQCNASTNQKFGGQGCSWGVDPISGQGKCFPRSGGFGGGGFGGGNFSMGCDSICEACNQTQCLARNASLPGQPACEWKSMESKCRPQGFINFGGGGGGGMFPCPSLDRTDRATCEVHSDCRWESFMLKCLIKESVMGCSSFCGQCTNITQCQSNSRCVWDTPPIGQPFCRENYGSGGGFSFGGNCQGNCFDCRNQQDCNGSSMGCRWISDPFGGFGHCESNTMSICSEECFACMTPATCAASNNSRGYDKALSVCGNRTNITACNAEQPYCNWTGSNCTSLVPSNCAWNPTYMYCKPNMSIEVCFAPGDEDGNGVEGCMDSACVDDPFCKFQPTGSGGGPMGTGVNCIQWDQMNGGNQSICENYTNGTATGCVWKNVLNPPFMNETRGVCEPKFNDFVFQGMQAGAPNMIYHDYCKRDPSDPEANVSDWADICDIGIKDMENTIGFVMQVYSVAGLSLCNSVYSNSLNKSGRYYLFLDTDANASTGCGIQVNITETDRNPSNFQFGEGGLEYKIDYIVSYNATSGNITETRVAYRCINSTTNSWALIQATLSGKKDEACMHNGIYLGVLKSDIDNPSKIRIIALSANASADAYNNATQIYYPSDRAGPAWYKPGTMDFRPPDCINNPTSCGSGFNVNDGVMRFEDCTPGTGDEDYDGGLNCGDSDCSLDPRCAGNTTYTPENDTDAPTITSSKVDAQSQFAMVFWTTDELATGVLSFYGANNTCESTPHNVSQPYDPSFPQSRYAPFHGVPLDPLNPRVADRVTLNPSTTYYYKMSSCDRARNNASGTISPNCAVSACLNFTTLQNCGSITNQTECQLLPSCKWDNTTSPATCKPGFPVAFNFIPSSSNPHDPLGNLMILINRGEGFENFNPNDVSYINCTTNSTLRFANPNTTVNNVTLPWSIDMLGCEVCTSASINLTDALFAGNTTNASTLYLGLGSAKWYQIAQLFACDNIYLNIPGENLSCDSAGIQKCNDNGSSCTTLAGDNATLISCNSTLITWSLPATSGVFSTYTIGSDEIPPLISGVSVQTSNTSAIVSWTTNENSNSTVDYGTNSSNLSLQATNTTAATAHVVLVTNLTTNTTYYYSVTSTDASGNPRTDNNSGAFYSLTPSESTTQNIALRSGWNLVSIPLSL